MNAESGVGGSVEITTNQGGEGAEDGEGASQLEVPKVTVPRIPKCRNLTATRESATPGSPSASLLV